MCWANEWCTRPGCNGFACACPKCQCRPAGQPGHGPPCQCPPDPTYVARMMTREEWEAALARVRAADTDKKT